MSKPIFYGDLVCKFKQIVGKPSFGGRLGSMVERCVGVECGLGVVWQSECLVLGPIAVHGCGFLFNCTMVDQASDCLTALA